MKTNKKGVTAPDMNQIVQILKNVAIAGGCLVLIDDDGKTAAVKAKGA